MSGAAQIRYIDDLTIGEAAERTRLVDEAAITAFAEVSDDRNPVHLDEAYAATTQFKGRIAHGMLSGAYISALMATELPGPGSIYLSQSLRFKRPVRIDDEVTIRVEVTGIDPDTARATLATTGRVNGKVVVEGEALVMLPKKPEA